MKYLNLDTDTTLGGDNASDQVVSSQKALKTYIDSRPSGGTVDQTFDGTSANAQSGVAIEGELANYVKSSDSDYYISNSGNEIMMGYMDDIDNPTEASIIQIIQSQGVLSGSIDRTDETNPLGFASGVTSQGLMLANIIDNDTILLSVENNNLAVNGNEVQTKLVSGTNIKTINNTSLLGSGNLSVGTVTSVNNTAPVNGNVTISIPTVNNATLTIQKNGTTVNTFTANSSSDVTANITVPTDTSDLTNNAGFITNSALSGYVQSTDLATVATSGSYNDLSNKPTIPQAQIQSDWNQTDSSAVDFIKNKPTIPSGVIVDQTFDGTSTNAQSGVAIAGELTNYVQLSDIDSTLSTTSENPVQNKIITNELNTKQTLLSSDNAGTGITILPEVTEWRVVVPDFPSPPGGWIGLAYNGTKILMLSSDGYVSTSEDGINWSTPTQNSTLVLSGSEWYDVIYDDTKFVAISVIYSGHIYVSTSVDGETWTTPAQKSITINSYRPYPRIAYDGTKYLIITPDGYVSTSEDGDTWTDGVDTGIRTGVDAGDFETLIYAKGKYVTVSNRGYVAVSTDGTTWNIVAFTGNPNGTNAWDELIFNGKEYILLGHYGGISISEDAIEWNFISPQSPRIQIGCNFATYINNKYVIFGYGSSRAYKFAVADQAIISSMVDQTFDGTSTNAQSGVAIAGELANYLQTSNNNVTFGNDGTTGGIIYEDSDTGEMYGTFIGYTPFGHGVMMGAVDPNGYLLGVTSSGINIFKGTTAHPTNGIALTVTNNNILAINGTEVALSTDIPTNISDLTDDTATNPVDKADTLTGLTATVTELNYTDGVTSNIQTQFDTITGKIPSQASTSNQLADKAFVNSSVQTATANFRGNWDTWALVPTSASSYPADYAGSTTPTVNDYLVVQDASDYTGDTLEGTWRFKYTGTWSTDGKSGWNPEYQVNETPLTSAQLAALNSGITSGDVTLIGTALQPNDSISELTNDARYIVNKTSATNAISILGSTSTAGISIGPSSSAVVGSVSIGNSATTNYGNNVAIGNSAQATGNNSNAIGYNAKATANTAIQIGDGTNSTASTLQVGFGTTNTNWQLLNGTTGLIPDARISGNIARTSAIPTVPTNISAFTNDSGYITSSALTDYVTTNTDQNITGTKTYVGQKKIGFKQSSSSDKLGFTLYNNNNVEKGYLEYNPSNTVDSVPLMTLGNYATASGGLTHVGFRKYSSISGANGAYNLLTPLISDAKTPFNLTTTYTNFYLPLGFTDGTTTIKTAKSGMVDISSLLPTIDQTYDGTSANAQSGVAIAGAGFLKNTATATNSLTIFGTTNNQNNSILIGYGTTTSSTNSTVIGNTAVSGGSYATALGYYARANDQYTTAIGNSSYASYQDTTAVGHNSQATAAGTLAVGSNSKATAQRATSIGYSSQATQYQATALGYEAKATANSALQIGTGTNSTANTLQVGSYTLLNTSTGLIPDARISSNIARTSQIITPTYDSTNERITW